MLMRSATIGISGCDPTVVSPIPELSGVSVAAGAVEACQGANALVVLTERGHFTSVSSESVRDAMAQPVVVDARNLLDSEAWKDAGFRYVGVGF